MAFWEKTKRGLDWLQHGYLLAQLLGSGVVGTVLRAVLMAFTHIPSIWITPIWLLASALSLLLFIKVWPYHHSAQQQIQKAGDGGALLMKTAKFDLAAIHKTYKMFDHRIMDEMRPEVTTALVHLHGQGREDVLIESLLSLIWGLTFYYTWNSIYGSQVRALQELNRHTLTRVQVHPFYAEVALANPQVYTNYGFEKWVGFMRSNLLLVEVGDQIAITIRGQAFLKFLLDCSLSERDKLY